MWIGRRADAEGGWMTGTVTSSGPVVLVVAVFLASAVEMVEALTIVLAVGVTRGWRSAIEGVTVALLALAALVVVLGPALVRLVPLTTLRLVLSLIHISEPTRRTP